MNKLEKLLAVGLTTLMLNTGCFKLKNYFHKEAIQEESQIEQTVKSMPLEDFLKTYTPPICGNAVTYQGFEEWYQYDKFSLTPPKGTIYGAKTSETYTLIDFANAFSLSDDEAISMAKDFIKIYNHKAGISADKLKIKREGLIRVDIYSTIPIKGRTIKTPYGYHILWKPNEDLYVLRSYIKDNLGLIQNNIIQKISQ